MLVELGDQSTSFLFVIESFCMRTLLFKENFAGSPLIPRIFGEKIVQLQATIVAEGLDQLTTCDLGPANSR